MHLEQPLEESLQLLASDDDPFCRWDAAQRLARQVLLARAANQPNPAVEAALIQALDQRICAYEVDDGMELAALLALPGMAELEALQSPVDPLALDQAFLAWSQEMGFQLQSSLRRLLEQARAEWTLAWPAGQGGRALTALAWRWLAAAGDATVQAEALAAVSGPSMTLARGALRALIPQESAEREQAMALFYDRWQDKPVILDAWFAMEASAPGPTLWSGFNSSWSTRASIPLRLTPFALFLVDSPPIFRRFMRRMAVVTGLWRSRLQLSTPAIRSPHHGWPKYSVAAAVMVPSAKRSGVRPSTSWQRSICLRTRQRWCSCSRRDHHQHDHRDQQDHQPAFCVAAPAAARRGTCSSASGQKTAVLTDQPPGHGSIGTKPAASRSSGRR